VPFSFTKKSDYIKSIVIILLTGVFLFLINIYDPNSYGIAKVKGDYSSLTSLFKMYRINNGHFPSTEQGFQALVECPTSEPIPHSWTALSDRIPIDPWNTPYRYTCADPFSKDINTVKISSAGKDGAFGTEDDYLLEPSPPPTIEQKINAWLSS
jgi:general secretion pathway protein G